ncbi:hypothetical protein D3C72_2012160 [compost metagenome]
MNAGRNAFQPHWTVEHRVQAGNIRQQYLRGTDIGVRFFATNVLLTRLHRHTQRGIARGIFRHTDNAARHRAFEFVFSGKECRVRAAVAHRHAKALRGTENNICALFARCR